MKRTMIGLAASTLLLAACGDKGADQGQVEGPVVSESEAPRNPAVDMNANASDAALTPGANSFTEAQARSAIEKQGYTSIGTLSQDTQGIWSAMATKDGAQFKVSVDYKGVVSASDAKQ